MTMNEPLYVHQLHRGDANPLPTAVLAWLTDPDGEVAAVLAVADGYLDRAHIERLRLCYGYRCAVEGCERRAGMMATAAGLAFAEQVRATSDAQAEARRLSGKDRGAVRRWESAQRAATVRPEG